MKCEYNFPYQVYSRMKNLFVSSSESWTLEKIEERLNILWPSSPFTTGGDFSKKINSTSKHFFVSPRSQTHSFIPSCRLTHLSFYIPRLELQCYTSVLGNFEVLDKCLYIPCVSWSDFFLGRFVAGMFNACWILRFMKEWPDENLAPNISFGT